MSESKKNNLVFLDESGVNINMTRRYARAHHNDRAIDNIPLTRPTNITILSSIRLNGKTVYDVYKGGTTAERFMSYLKETLLPTLSKNDIIVMDNMRSHHAKIVRQLLDGAGIQYCYLPPYSPDLNPIEKMWSKIKACLRTEKARFQEKLFVAIGKAFSFVTPSDCRGWFRDCCLMH